MFYDRRCIPVIRLLNIDYPEWAGLLTGLANLNIKIWSRQYKLLQKLVYYPMILSNCSNPASYCENCSNCITSTNHYIPHYWRVHNKAMFMYIWVCIHAVDLWIEKRERIRKTEKVRERSCAYIDKCARTHTETLSKQIGLCFYSSLNSYINNLVTWQAVLIIGTVKRLHFITGDQVVVFSCKRLYL